MAAQRGFEYEENLLAYLISHGYAPAGSSHAGADDSVPDITIQNSEGITAGVEVKKLEGAAYGSSTLGFDYLDVARKGERTARPWVLLNPAGSAQQLLVEMANRVDLINTVNMDWWTNGDYYIPSQIETGGTERKLKEAPTPQRSKNDMYRDDLGKMSDINIPCPAQNIRNYYTSKGNSYIMLGDKGLFWLGGEDPLRISANIPQFNPTNTYFRCRVQSKGSDVWHRYAVELYCSGVGQSQYSIGKCDTNANIIEDHSTTNHLSFLG